jgi:hypothetical protein
MVVINQVTFDSTSVSRKGKGSLVRGKKTHDHIDNISSPSSRIHGPSLEVFLRLQGKYRGGERRAGLDV